MKPGQPHKIGTAQGHASNELAQDRRLAYPDREMSGQFRRHQNDGNSKNDARDGICVLGTVSLRTEDGRQEQKRANDEPSTTSHGSP